MASLTSTGTGPHSIVKTWDQATEDKLIQSALDARKNAYCPYSTYQVGSSLLTKDLKIFSIVNYFPWHIYKFFKNGWS